MILLYGQYEKMQPTEGTGLPTFAPLYIAMIWSMLDLLAALLYTLPLAYGLSPAPTFEPFHISRSQG